MSTSMRTLTVRRVVALLTIWGASSTMSLMAQGGPPKLSSNPGNHVIFPAKGQDAAQQEKDEIAAYAWASEKTGWDPYKALEELAKQNQVKGAAADSTKGKAVGGAARGALLGLAVGAIAGDAGEGAAIGAAAGGLTAGMRGRQTRGALEASAKGGEAEYKKKFADWDKHFVVAMEGKGYTLK